MRIVLAEDSVLLREGLAGLLTDSGHEVVGRCGDGARLLALAVEHEPDVVITDIRMPPGFVDEGVRAAVEIRRRLPSVGILLLSQHIETHFALELVSSGSGFGYLLKDRILDVDDFLASLLRVARGGSALDPVVVATLLQPRLAPTIPRPTDALSERERTVLSLMAQGYSNAAIARELWLTERTVESHVSAVFSRLGLVASRDENRRVLAVIAHLTDQERGG